MVRLRHLAVVLSLSCSVALVDAQPSAIKFDRLAKEHELSQSTINAIVQDSLGYLWFGTQDGLNRFDGYTVTVFKRSLTDTNTLADNSIWTLRADARGALWIGTMRGGVDRYDPASNRFHHHRHSTEDSTSLSENNVISLFEDSRGDIWLGTLNAGLNRYNRTTQRFERFRFDRNDPHSLSNNTVWSIAEDRHGNLWIATWRGLCRLDLTRSPMRFHRYLHDPRNPRSLASDNVRVVLVDRSGTLWVGTWGAGLDRFDERTETFHHYSHDANNPNSISSNLILSLLQDRRGNLWVGTGDRGLNLYRQESDDFERFEHDPQNPTSLSNNIISALFEDRAGTLWIGTGAGGVNMLDTRRNRFVHYRDIPSDSNDMHGNDVWAILEDSRGELWVGTYGNGLNRFNRQRTRVVNYQFDRRSPRSLSHNNVLALCETDDGSIWIGTEGGGLNRFDRASGVFSHIRHSMSGNSLSHDEITALRADRRGHLWIGNNGGGIDVLDLQTGTLRTYRADENNPRALAGTSIMCIYEDRTGAMWIGSFGGGLHRYDPTSDSFIRYGQAVSSGTGLNNNTVLSIYRDEDGILWIGTYGGGLNRFDMSTGRFDYLTHADGLPNDVVYGILPDDHGNLWLSTNRGIAKVHPRTREIRIYDAEDGLQANEFNQGAYFRSTRGELFFGGLNGFNAFLPDSIRDNDFVPPVYLSSFRVFDRHIDLPQALAATRHITLSYDQNFFSFEFVALNFISPDKNRYAYKLQGLDRDWIVVPASRRYASYTNVDPGEYVLRIKASNNDGVWNEEGISIAITITPPYWRTWWFQGLVVVVLAALLYAMYRYRVSKLVEIERIRASIATDLHDDIGSTLTEIALYSDVGLRELRAASNPHSDSNTARVEALLESIGTTSRGLIDAMNDIVWAVDPKNDSFEFLLLRMKTHAARMFDAKGINYEIDIPEELSRLHLPLAFRRRFYLIFKEAVNNILRHAHASKVTLTIRKDGRSLAMSIVDDGKGFQPGQVREGNGLTNMRRRAESLNGELLISSSPGKGTAISLKARIP